MKCRIITSLVLCLMCHNFTYTLSSQRDKENPENMEFENPNNEKRHWEHTRDCIKKINSGLKTGNWSDTIKMMRTLEKILEETYVENSSKMITDHIKTLMYRPTVNFTSIEIQATEHQISASCDPYANGNSLVDSKVHIHLPKELDVGSRTIVFCMVTFPESSEIMGKVSGTLYENRMVGLKVQDKNVSGLHEHINITMSFSMGINETQEPRCVFLDYSTGEYSTSGCLTVWKRGHSNITCTCNHLTYFGVLLVTVPLSQKDQQILMYISQIGCGLSLVALALTVLLFIMSRKIRANISMRVHINLVIALLLLNVHFLPTHTVAQSSSSGMCLYIALALHYSLLATYSWMAIEGFHLYLFLIRVFNIYIRKYILKLCLVGWGTPAIIVALVVIIDRESYGLVRVDSVYANSTAICYISNNIVKMVTTLGTFSLLFAFNVTMLGVTVRHVVRLPPNRTRDDKRAKQDICTLLGVTTLLGITWGLIFFSFGSLSTPALYSFCILNSLQGAFIFIWFVLSLRKSKKSDSRMSSETHTTNSQPAI